ncbi:hypothetical protein AVEN_218518-1 [Araneus ventricosus]|uniref:Prokineticin domain-containing protein n=1 Tax=Araneus ventricosus TaxID=182803 RepID=A0A4Y2JMG6_ARAVE|nr:hypothetical protein AVEN_218518-1 [Araneus ventricosus]
MKYLIIIALCFFLVVEVTAPPPIPHWPIRPKHKLCNTAQECEADQCCVKFGPSFFRKGRCVKLSSEGKRCSQEELAKNGKYFGRCPCAEGLHCEAKDVVETKTVFAKSCKKADDCEEDECCLNYVSFGGHCQKLTPEGQSCTPLVNDVEKKPDMYNFQCPCKDGLKCVPKHEIKIGEHITRHRAVCVVPGDVMETM